MGGDGGNCHPDVLNTGQHSRAWCWTPPGRLTCLWCWAAGNKSVYKLGERKAGFIAVQASSQWHRVTLAIPAGNLPGSSGHPWIRGHPARRPEWLKWSSSLNILHHNNLSILHSIRSGLFRFVSAWVPTKTHTQIIMKSNLPKFLRLTKF